MQGFRQNLRRRVTKPHGAPSSWEFNESAIFRNDGIDEMQVAANTPQVIEDAAGYEDDDDSTSSKFSDCRSNFGIQSIVLSDCPVKIECQDQKLHEGFLGRLLRRFSYPRSFQAALFGLQHMNSHQRT
jgi:hypothetical protein